MNPSCQFCHESVSRVCCFERCNFNPFICGKQCVSEASSKVHSHWSLQQSLSQSHSVHFIPFQSLAQIIQSKTLTDHTAKVNKIKTRITQKVEKMAAEFEDLHSQLFRINPVVKEILMKIEQSSQSLSGKNIHTILMQQFYNQSDPRIRLILELEQNLLVIYNIIQQVLGKYQSYISMVELSNQNLQQSEILLVESRYNESLDLLKQARKLNPLNPQILFQISYCYQKLGQYQESMLNYQHIIQFYPEASSHAYNNIGSLYFRDKQFIKSIEYYSKAIEGNKSISKYYFNRGNAWSYLSHNQEAIADFSMAIELCPTNASYYCNRGIGYKELGRYQESYQDFSKALELESNPNYSYNRDLVFSLIAEKEETTYQEIQQ